MPRAGRASCFGSTGSPPPPIYIFLSIYIYPPPPPRRLCRARATVWARARTHASWNILIWLPASTPPARPTSTTGCVFRHRQCARRATGSAQPGRVPRIALGSCLDIGCQPWVRAWILAALRYTYNAVLNAPRHASSGGRKGASVNLRHQAGLGDSVCRGRRLC